MTIKNNINKDNLNWIDEYSIPDFIKQMGDIQTAKSALDDLIVNGELQFPFRTYFIDPPEVMMKRLREFQPKPIWNRYILKSYYPRSNPKLYLPPTFRGDSVYLLGIQNEYDNIDILSDHFIEDVRLRTHRSNTASVIDYWVQPELRSKFLDELLKQERLDYPTMRNVLYRMTFESKQFRLTWVKGLYQLVGIKPGSKVLDISAGWGDRLLAAIANNNEYLGFDPNTELEEGHDKIIRMFGDSSKHRIIYKPFEEVKPEEIGSGYDLVLSSPPFFDLEIYPGGPNEEKTQSIYKFPDINTWLKGFLFPSIQTAWNALKPGGYLVIHLGDTKELQLAEPFNLFVEEYLPGSSYEGIIGVSGEEGFARPVWVWRKVGPNEPRRIWKPQIHRSLRNLYPELGLLKSI